MFLPTPYTNTKLKKNNPICLQSAGTDAGK